MTATFRGVKIFYRFFNRKSGVVNVFLHGWGDSSKSWLFCAKFLQNQTALFVDFPPFGQSGKHPNDWTIFSYAHLVAWLCERLNIKKYNLVGHSFGGRVAIVLAAICKNEVQKVVLVDAAGLKPRRSVKYWLKIWWFKLKKRLNMDVSKCGSPDFLALDSKMRQVFVGIVNTHLDQFLRFICAPTLVVFGENDTTTPLYMAKKLHKKIKNSQLVILKNAGHFCFLDCRVEFLNQLKNFLN